MPLSDDELQRLATGLAGSDLADLRAAEEAALAEACKRAGVVVSLDQLGQLVAPEIRRDLALGLGQGPAPAVLTAYQGTEALERLFRQAFGPPAMPAMPAFERPRDDRAELARVRALLADLAGDFPTGVRSNALAAARAYLAEHPGEAAP
jgi:hypothetical protein